MTSTVQLLLGRGHSARPAVRSLRSILFRSPVPPCVRRSGSLDLALSLSTRHPRLPWLAAPQLACTVCSPLLSAALRPFRHTPAAPLVPGVRVLLTGLNTKNMRSLNGSIGVVVGGVVNSSDGGRLPVQVGESIDY